MEDNSDNPPSLYKDIRLSDITRRFEFPFEFTKPTSSSSLQPPTLLLPQSQQLQSYVHQIQYLRSQVIRLSHQQIEYSTYKRDYQLLSDKYEQMLNENIRIHTLIKSGGELQNQLSEANNKISSLMRQNQCLHKLKSLQQKQMMKIKSELQNQQRKGMVLEGKIQILMTQKVQLQHMMEDHRREKQLLLGKYDKQIQQVKVKMEQNQNRFRGERHNIEALEGMKFNLEKDIKELRLANKNLQQSLRLKNDQIVKLVVKINQNQFQQQQFTSLKKQIEVKDNLYKDLKLKYDKQTQELTSNFSLKFNTILHQNQSFKTKIESLQNIHNSSLTNIQTLQSQVITLQDTSSKLQLQNTKLSSALFASRVQSQQSRRKNTQISRITYDAQHYKGQNERLKQQLTLIKKKHKQLEHNYSTLMNDVKQKNNYTENTNEKPRQSYQSRKSTRSSKSKQPRHAEISLISTSRTRSSHKSHTQLQELSNVNQYKNVIESKLMKNNLSKNDSMNQSVMRKYKLFFNSTGK